MAVHQAALAVDAARGGSGVGDVLEGSLVGGGLKDYVPAAAAVPAVGLPKSDEFLAVEGDTTVAALAARDFDPAEVDKVPSLEICSAKKKKMVSISLALCCKHCKKEALLYLGSQLPFYTLRTPAWLGSVVWQAVDGSLPTVDNVFFALVVLVVVVTVDLIQKGSRGRETGAWHELGCMT